MKTQKTIMMKKYNILLALFTVFVGFSQDYTGILDTISQKGLHTIMLTSEIRSATDNNFNFLRIKDAQENEVPYVIIHPRDKVFLQFNPLENVSKRSIKDSITSILIENKTRKIQEYIALQIANTTLSKRYTIYGSNDTKTWFGLVANKRISGLNSTQKTYVEKLISFPLNTYQFLRINFYDKHSLPINILGVGSYESKIFTQNPVEVTDFKKEIVSIKDRKVTQLKFTANNAHKIDILSLNISTEFFQRNAKLIVQRTRKIKKRLETYDEVIARFKLSSDTQNTFLIHNLNERKFILEIDNQDNPELIFEGIELFQKPVYLVANLNEKENYNLIVDHTLKRPSYDLGNFISDNTKTINKVSITNFFKVDNEDIQEGKSFIETNLFMWICIILGGILVVYFALGLLKDVSKQE